MTLSHIRHGFAAAAIIVMSTGAAQATNIMPDFGDVPTGWTTDRYEPHSFSNVGTYQGRNDVLGIEIHSDEGASNRSASFQSSFYNTQGRKHVAVGGIGDMLAADLYIPTSWGNEANGTVRTGMWGVMNDGIEITAYPILGFTNEGGTDRFRVWNGAAWVDLADAILYDEWNALSIEFTGTDFNFYVNGMLAYTDATVDGSTGFQDVIMQAYNYYDDSTHPDANPINYTAYWSNSIPEPGTLALFGIGLAGLGLARRRRPAA